tara:strand:- start:7869 stop:8780 length:912 start_codon:yes stop_codon:yes gene_type:complete
MFSYLIWFPFDDLEIKKLIRSLDEFKYIGASILTLFFLGLKDDIVGTVPTKKLLVHVVVAFILVIMANIRITSMHGIFGVEEFPEWMSILFSVLVYTVVVNAFNLIDGVDGLAGGVGFIASVAFGIWFFLAGDMGDSLLAFSLAGSLLGFLIYNFNPAKIFMGDSGSLTIGLIISILSIKLIEYDVSEVKAQALLTFSKPIFVMACIVYPLIDTFRIFIYRLFNGSSPFAADNNHLHHRLIDMGLNHGKVVLIIYLYTLVFIAIAVLWNSEPSIKLIALSLIALAMVFIPAIIKRIKTTGNAT